MKKDWKQTMVVPLRENRMPGLEKEVREERAVFNLAKQTRGTILEYLDDDLLGSQSFTPH